MTILSTLPSYILLLIIFTYHTRRTTAEIGWKHRNSTTYDLIVFHYSCRKGITTISSIKRSGNKPWIPKKTPQIEPPEGIPVSVYRAGEEGMVWVFQNARIRDETYARLNQTAASATATQHGAFTISTMSTSNPVWLELPPKNINVPPNNIFNLAIGTEILHEWDSGRHRLLTRQTTNLLQEQQQYDTLIGNGYEFIPLSRPTDCANNRPHRYNDSDNNAVDFPSSSPSLKNALLSYISRSQYATHLAALSGNINFTLDEDTDSHSSPSRRINTRYAFSGYNGNFDGIELAEDYIASRLNKSGYSRYNRSSDDNNNVREDTVEIRSNVNCEYFFGPSTTSSNVIAIKMGTVHPDQIVVVGAHLDAVQGVQLWMHTEDDERFRAPGAEDNASGAAAVVALAEIFSRFETEKTLHFVAFGCEEMGLYGSERYVQDACDRGDNIAAMVNLDMISAWKEDFAIIVSSNPEFEPLMSLFKHNAENYTNLTTVYDTEYLPFRSDQGSFLSEGIPAILAIEDDWGEYNSYHTRNDTFDKLDIELGDQVLRAAAATIADLAGLAKPKPIRYLRHKQEKMESTSFQ